MPFSFLFQQTNQRTGYLPGKEMFLLDKGFIKILSQGLKTLQKF